MQSLLDLLVGLVVLAATAALSQFGIDLNAPKPQETEVHRTADCPDDARPPALIPAVSRDA